MTALFIFIPPMPGLIPVIMTDKDISKFMSLVLRHAPETAGLSLDQGGWCDLASLAAAAPGAPSTDDLIRIVDQSDKQRFALSPDQQKIRANQGHSIPVDLGLAPAVPPAILYHGTALHNLPAIWREGLRRGQRNHVHLSPDPVTARRVGQRHGKPQVLAIDTRRMCRAGFEFMRADNNVWLTERVPPCYLKEQE